MMDGEGDFVITDKINTGKFIDFFSKNENSNIFQSLEMAEVYRKTKGCDSIHLIAMDGDRNGVIGSLMAKINQPLNGLIGGYFRYSTIRYGPLFDGSRPEIVSELIKEYDKRTNGKLIYTRIYPNDYLNKFMGMLPLEGYLPEYWRNFLIRIDRPIDELWEGLKRSRRRGIKKAKTYGVKVTDIEGKDELFEFYELIRERYRMKKIPLEHISKFEAAYKIFKPKGQAKFMVAKYKDEIIASALFLLFRDVVYLWYNGSRKDGLRYHPNDLLIWEAIRWSSENGYRIFDWGGGGTEKQAAEGWVKFKRRFGGVEVNQGRYTKYSWRYRFAEVGLKLRGIFG